MIDDGKWLKIIQDKDKAVTYLRAKRIDESLKILEETSLEFQAENKTFPNQSYTISKTINDYNSIITDIRIKSFLKSRNYFSDKNLLDISKKKGYLTEKMGVIKLIPNGFDKIFEDSEKIIRDIENIQLLDIMEEYKSISRPKPIAPVINEIKENIEEYVPVVDYLEGIDLNKRSKIKFLESKIKELKENEVMIDGYTTEQMQETLDILLSQGHNLAEFDQDKIRILREAKEAINRRKVLEKELSRLRGY